MKYVTLKFVQGLTGKWKEEYDRIHDDVSTFISFVLLLLMVYLNNDMIF
jgi:hypothetical protein